jgi:prolyl-tRNA synthetase
MAQTAITPTREENFPEWYQQVIKAADLADNAATRGCMVIKPYGYAIWENIQKIFDAKIKKLGVQNAYFPMLIPIEFLSKEAEHISGFAKECAVVTHHRLKADSNGKLIPDGELESPFIIRPTSETVIGNAIKDWIHSYRDLPLKLNQWCNVMRWEMRTRMFLRTSEFLWQEGHNVFETEKEAHEDALKMLNAYYDFATLDLALPAIKGEKTEEERFPGAKNTYTFETMMQDGKALQAGTSHYLGQTFAQAFNLKFLDRANNEQTAYTTSWGISTRLIGGIIMSHSDDDGLVLPPAVAPYQVVIIPFTKNDGSSDNVLTYAQKIGDELEALGLRYFIDLSEESGSNKTWKWIKKGAPIRLEIGGKEAENASVTVARRDGEKGNKISLSEKNLNQLNDILKDITKNLYAKACGYRDSKTTTVKTLSELEKLFANDYKGFVLIEKGLTDSSDFTAIAEKYSLSRRCMPLESNGKMVIIAKSY